MAMQASSNGDTSQFPRGFSGDIAASYCSAMIRRFGQLKTWQILQ